MPTTQINPSCEFMVEIIVSPCSLRLGPGMDRLQFMSSKVDTFPETEWSIILDAASGNPDRARQGIRRLCESYRPVILRWFQARVSPQQAEDCTHDFLLKLLNVAAPWGASLEYRRNGTRFRNFLSTALHSFAMKVHRRDTALKRGGGSLHIEFSEVRVSGEAWADPPSIDLDLALEIHQRALAAAAIRFFPGSAGGAIPELGDFVHGGSLPDYAGMSARLGVRVAALRTALMRLRRHYHETFRSQVAGMTMPDQVSEEHIYLVGLLAAHGIPEGRAGRPRQVAEVP